MADDNSARYRSNDPIGRGPGHGHARERSAGRIGPADRPERSASPNTPGSARLPAAAGTAGTAVATGCPARTAPQPRRSPANRRRSTSNRRRAIPSPRRTTIRRRNTARTQQYGEPSPPRRPRATLPTIRRRYSRPNHASHNDWPGSPPAPASGRYPLAAAPYAPRHPLRITTTGLRQPELRQSSPMPIPHGRPGTESYSPDRPAFGAAGFPAPPDRPGYAPPLYPHEPEAGGDAAAA